MAALRDTLIHAVAPGKKRDLTVDRSGTQVLDPAHANFPPSVNTRRPHVPPRRFLPVYSVARIPMWPAVLPALRVKPASDLIGLAKAKPDQLTYATQGLGSSADMAMLLFAEATGAKGIPVPYKDGAPGRIDLLAGNVTMMFDKGTAA